MKDTAVPSLPHRFFKWYCRADRYEEIHGDLEELFYARILSRGKFKAKLLYTWDVIRCCQPYAWRSSKRKIEFYMFKNYLTISLRVLGKNPVSSFINIVGLSLAIGICVLVYGFAQWTLTKDDFHVNRNTVYQTTAFSTIAGKAEQLGNVARPLGEMLKNDFPEIDQVCRIQMLPTVVKYGDQVFHERLHVTDASYLKMFTFPLKWGNPATLNDLNSIVLSEEMSAKYFGTDNPVGQELQLLFNNGEKSKLFKVTGVAAKFPETRSFSFNFLINYQNLNWIDSPANGDDWTATTDALFIQVRNANDLKRIEAGMAKYKKLWNESNDERQLLSFAFEPLATLYKNAGPIRNSISSKGYRSNRTSIMFLTVIAAMMLALACFNYINIAVSSSTKRAKEIGVRKTIGATNGKVISQFLTENAMLSCFALVFGALLGAYVIIPWFQHINDFNMDFSLLNKNVWLFLAGVLVLTSFTAGLYPSLVVSRFRTAEIFKGTVRYGKQKFLTKVLLGFQLVIASVLIVSAVMFTSNSIFLGKQSWGYTPQGVVYSQVIDTTGFQKLRDKLVQNPHVLAISGATHHVGLQYAPGILELPQHDDMEIHQLNVGHDYVQTLQIELEEGRLFHSEQGSDARSVLINHTLAEILNISSSGGTIRLNGEDVTVVGILKDFRFFDFDHVMEPTVFRVADEAAFKFIALRVESGKELEVYQDLQRTWATLFPEIPFQGGFQEDVWGPFFQEMALHGKFWRGMAFITILLAGLGLYGLVSLNVAGRVKEFSIRKVLGATASSISGNLLRNYVGLYVISLLSGGAISYYSVKFMLDIAYEFHVPMSVFAVLFAAFVLVSALLLVAATQVSKLVKSNPLVGLKSE